MLVLKGIDPLWVIKFIVIHPFGDFILRVFFVLLLFLVQFIPRDYRRIHFYDHVFLFNWVYVLCCFSLIFGTPSKSASVPFLSTKISRLKIKTHRETNSTTFLFLNFTSTHHGPFRFISWKQNSVTKRKVYKRTLTKGIQFTFSSKLHCGR